MTNARLLTGDVLRPAVRLERHLPDPPSAAWKAGLAAAPDAWKQRFDASSAQFEPVIGPQAGPPAEYRGNRPRQES
jgi:hypothetical protein